MKKVYGKKSESSLNFNNTEATLTPDPLEVFDENSNTNSMLQYFNAIQNNFFQQSAPLKKQEQIKPDLDLLDLSIFREISIFSEFPFDNLNLIRRIEQISENFHFSPSSMGKQDVSSAVLSVYQNFIQQNKSFYVLSQNFSILFIGNFCLLATKNKNQQKFLERHNVQFKQFHQQNDQEINENSLSFFSDSEELFLIKNKYIDVYFEILLNELINDNNFELISNHEFHLAKKLPFKIRQNQKVDIKTHPELSYLIQQTPAFSFLDPQNFLYKIKVEGAMTVQQINELQNELYQTHTSVHVQKQKLETTRLFHQQMLK